MNSFYFYCNIKPYSLLIGLYIQGYRDYIDLVKLLQLIPRFEAIVGAYANYNLHGHLGEATMNAYRFRILSEPPKDY